MPLSRLQLIIQPPCPSRRERGTSSQRIAIVSRRERLRALFLELSLQVIKAKDRGDIETVLGRTSGTEYGDIPSAAYWYGAQFGYQDAAQRIGQLLAAGDPE